MEDFSQLFTILIGGYGVYFIYQWIRVTIQKKEIDVSSFLLNTMTLDNCSDVPAMTAFVLPWILVIGISLVIYAAVSLLMRGSMILMVVMLVYFTCLIVAYTILVRQAKKRFWPELLNKKDQ